MQDTKLVQVLMSLSAKEMKKLHKFVYSPYFNENELISRLFDILKKCYPKFDNKKITRTKVFKQLFAKEKYSDLKLRRLMSKLLKLTEDFIAHECLGRKKILMQLETLDFYKIHNLSKHFQSTLNTTINLHKKTINKDEHYYYQAYLLANEQRDAFLLNNEPIRSIKFNQNLQHIANNLEIFYLIHKMKLSCSMLNHSHIIPFKYELLFLDEITKSISNQKYLDVPLIQLYHATLLMLQDETDSRHFHQLKKLLQKYGQDIPVLSAIDLYTYAKNHCIWQLNKGKKSFYQEFFDIFKDELTKLVDAHNQDISSAAFHNMVKVGTLLGHFGWVENFIQEYKSKIVHSQPEDVANYCLAYLFFYKKEYNKAIQLLFQADFKDIFFKIDSRTLLLRIYYEQDEFDATDNLINSLRVFIHSKKKLISEAHIQSNRHFLNFLTAITKVIPGDQKKIDTLVEEIQQTRPLANKKWLREKLEELR